MQLAIQATLSENGQKITLFIPRLNSVLGSLSYLEIFKDIYEQASTILGIKSNMIVITLDNVLMYPAGKHFDLFKHYYDRTGLFIQDKLSDLNAPSSISPFYRIDNTIREI